MSAAVTVHGHPAAEMAWLRARLAHDIEQCATLYWWSVYSVKDAVQVLHARALWFDAHQIRAGEMAFTIKLRDAVERFLDEAIGRHGEAHAAAFRAMTAAARAQINERGDRNAAAAAAASCAARHDPLPPAYLVQQATEQAAKEIRMSESWWTKRTP